MAMPNMSDRLILIVSGVLGAILGLILVLLIIGNDSIITQINNGLTAICNSGWPLASLFNPSNGIVPLLIVVGVFIASIVFALGIGVVATKTRK